MRRGRARWILAGCMIALGVAAAGWVSVGVVNLATNPASLTAAYGDRGRDLANVRNEFGSRARSESRVFEGEYLGGGGLHRTQFGGVLEGGGRFLNVDFPESILEDVVVHESGTGAGGGTSAWLVVRMHCCVELETAHALLDLGEGSEKGPDEVLSSCFGHDAGAVRYPAAVCDMDMTNVRDQTTRCWLWKEGPVVSSAGGAAVRPYDWDLEWRVRDRRAIGARRFGVVGTAILDVLTGPVQLGFWALVGPAIVR
jgi:hypothetical protein